MKKIIKKLQIIKMGIIKNFSWVNIIGSLIGVILMALLKYTGLISNMLQFLDIYNLINEYIILGVIGLTNRLFIKGIIKGHLELNDSNLHYDGQASQESQSTQVTQPVQESQSTQVTQPVQGNTENISDQLKLEM
jgi:hypothetical protein